jgi:hypothetical protein
MAATYLPCRSYFRINALGESSEPGSEGVVQRNKGWLRKAARANLLVELAIDKLDNGMGGNAPDFEVAEGT